MALSYRCTASVGGISINQHEPHSMAGWGKPHLGPSPHKQQSTENRDKQRKKLQAEVGDRLGLSCCLNSPVLMCLSAWAGASSHKFSPQSHP